MAPTPSSSSSSAKSNQTQFTLIRTPQSKHRLNFISKPPNPDHTPPEHPVEVIGRIRDHPDRKEKPPSILQANPDNNQTVRVRADAGYRDFTLDGVSFSEEEGIESFYKRFVEERIKGVKAGEKCTVVMYGPTGAGKSHTMFGGCGGGRGKKEPGVVYRSLREILDGGVVAFVQVTVLEVYNEEIYDLLSTNCSSNLGIGCPKGGTTKARLEVMGKKAKNATFISGTDAGKISKEIAKVEKRRIVKSTLCNERSSRSHCIIILDVPTVGGRLMLVDMAGSENIDQAGQTGFEAKMQDSFEDDKSKILMILCASPDPKEMHKTLCTLEYGAKAKCIVRGSHTPNKDKNGGDESSSRIAAMDEFISKLQSEKKQQEKERNDAQKQLKKKEEEVAALRSLLLQKEACAATNEEEAIEEKVNERTQRLKAELEKKLEECRRMAEEFVEMERRRMEERIVQQQEELEMMRRRLEEIEVEFRRSRGTTDETSGFAKRLRSLYSDDDMVKSMDLDMGDPVWGSAVSYQPSNTISSNLSKVLQPKPQENMVAQMYPDRVCLSTVFEEEEVEEDEEKVIVEDKSICSVTTRPMPSLNFGGLGKENCVNSTAGDKEPASCRKLRIENIFTLCGNQRELSQHTAKDEVLQAKNDQLVSYNEQGGDEVLQAKNDQHTAKDEVLQASSLAVEEAKENNISKVH
ncbi:hypothetical protein Bca4012_006939 [Brassica carinata]